MYRNELIQTHQTNDLKNPYFNSMDVYKLFDSMSIESELQFHFFL